MHFVQERLRNYQSSINFPPELCVKPLALIGFSGLDTLNNAIHKSVWEAFNNRVEKAPILYRLIKNDHEFPVIKPKRNSYDWYIPKGILKRNWMNKHLYEIPSVIVIFYDLDWKDNFWNEKMIECASRVQSMRAALEGRDTRIIVVLIQNELPVPDDPLASERAIALCSSCELNAQSLYILPHGQYQLGYTIKLENAFFDFAQNYYHNEAKIVKSHKEHLNKNSHQNLHVRHQFKLGFLNELKQDFHTALKHYTHAYNNLLDIRIVDTNALEIRTIAGFINYKLCRLMFALSLPRDAISQFKAHIDRFKIKMGFQELMFEHYAWLSKQYEVFGDVFDEAVKQDLPAVQTQHPGLYYQQAAQYAILRKKTCQELCSTSTTYPKPDPLEGDDRMEFYGQRPWRPGKISGEPPEPQIESNGIKAIQYLENQINHSAIIIALYGLAITQFKKYKCPRTKRQLVLQMADECYNSKDFGQALTLYLHMLTDYRQERWWNIISEILGKAIKCAYLSANVQDYVQIALEILSAKITLSMHEKKRIYENLNRVLKKQIPFGDSKLSHEILQNAILAWQPVLKEPANYSLNMSKIFACIETKAKFTKDSYEIDQNIAIEVYVRSTCPFPLTFTKISVTVNTPNISSEFAITNIENTPLTFQNKEVKKFNVEFTPDPTDIGKEIQIDSINLQIGNAEECCLNLKYNDLSSSEDLLPELQYFKYYKGSVDFENIRSSPSAIIVPRSSKLDVHFEHAYPALVGEWYPVTVHIGNEEYNDIKDLKIELCLSEEERQDVEIAHEPSGKPQKIPVTLACDSTLDVKAKISANIYVKCHQAGKKKLQFQITYVLKTEKSIISIKNDVIDLEIVQPFSVDTKYLSSRMSEIHKFYVDEEFEVMAILNFSSPWTIVIEDASINFITPVKAVEANQKSQLAGKSFHNKESGADIYLAVCDKASEQNVTVAEYNITWKRENGIATTTQTTLYGHHCEWIPLDLKLIAPAHGYVGTPMLITYELKNRSSQLLQLDVTMEDTMAFMFAGYKQYTISILPESVQKLDYFLYPVPAGNVILPKLLLSVPEDGVEGPSLRQDQIVSLLERALPTHLYVMPRQKGLSELPTPDLCGKPMV